MSACDGWSETECFTTSCVRVTRNALRSHMMKRVKRKGLRSHVMNRVKKVLYSHVC